MALTRLLSDILATLNSSRPFLYLLLKHLHVHFQSNTMLTTDGGPLLPDRLKGLWNLLTNKTEQLQMTCKNIERISVSALYLNSEQNQTIK
ncbi:hypothetical protein I4U23_017630 [Adineta vaga]|nr:hypothetical protein I4U23_017630 [Adineta vaga]